MADPVVKPAVLHLVLQQTSGAIIGRLDPDFQKAVSLLAPFALQISLIIQRTPLSFPDPFDPINDFSALRKASEALMPHRPDLLRVVASNFTVHTRDTGDTNLDSIALIALNTASIANDNCSLIHEMIHATGLTGSQHDPDKTSVFFANSGGQPPRGILKSVHAQRLSVAFFAS